MATVLLGVSTASTTNAATYASGSFTPAANDLLVALVSATDTVSAGSMTDTQSLGWTLVATAVKASSADTFYLFIANAKAAASAMTVTADFTGDNATGCVIQVLRVSGMSRVGSYAVRVTSSGQQIAKQENQASGTPSVLYPNITLTENPTIGVVFLARNPAAMTPPTSWVELNDTGYGTPTTGVECVSMDSGFAGQTVTWGNTTGSVFASLILELDTSPPSSLPSFPPSQAFHHLLVR